MRFAEALQKVVMHEDYKENADQTDTAGVRFSSSVFSCSITDFNYVQTSFNSLETRVPTIVVM